MFLMALATASLPARADNIDVVRQYYAAINAQDLDKAMSFVADDAEFINPMGSFRGAEAIRAHLGEVFKEGIAFLLTDFRDDNGVVGYDYEVMVAGAIVEEGTGGITIVKDGKIVFDGTEETMPR
jgi:ketosteroid isomerase-like protein